MTNDYEQITIISLKNLARERGKTGYSRLDKSELIHLDNLLEKS